VDKAMSIFNTSEKNLYLMRHAEAYKNLDKMHGGGNQELTELGREQARRRGAYLLWLTSESGSSLDIFHQAEGRSEKTASIVGEELGLVSRLVEKISGVGLGIIADLNEDQLAEQYPEVAAILDNWKTGGAKLQDYPDVPGREHMNDFAQRIGEGMQYALEGDNDVVIVGTTSTLNMMNHLLENDGAFDVDRYDFVTFPLAGMDGWILSKDFPPKRIILEEGEENAIN
jgi:broad specificity phosphatase PhoE